MVKQSIYVLAGAFQPPARKGVVLFFAALAWVIAQIRFCQLPFARKGGENISERLSKQKIFPFKLAAKISYRLLPSQCHTRWGIILVGFRIKK